MKQLFVIYGKPATGKTELIEALDGLPTALDVLQRKNTFDYDFFEDILINKEKGTVVIDNFYDGKDVNKIIDLFKNGYKEFIKFKGNEYYKIRKIILVGYRNLNEDEVMKIKNKVNDEVMISSFEAKKFIEGEWK